MFGIRKIAPQCLGCGDKNVKLSRKSMCNWCEWAISQRKDLGKEKREREDAVSALQQLDDAREYADAKLGDTIKAVKIEGAILIERNIKLKAELVRAFRKIKSLEAI